MVYFFPFREPDLICGWVFYGILARLPQRYHTSGILQSRSKQAKIQLILFFTGRDLLLPFVHPFIPACIFISVNFIKEYLKFPQNLVSQELKEMFKKIMVTLDGT